MKTNNNEGVVEECKERQYGHQRNNVENIWNDEYSRCQDVEMEVRSDENMGQDSDDEESKGNNVFAEDQNSEELDLVFEKFERVMKYFGDDFYPGEREWDNIESGSQLIDRVYKASFRALVKLIAKFRDYYLKKYPTPRSTAIFTKDLEDGMNAYSTSELD